MAPFRATCTTNRRKSGPLLCAAWQVNDVLNYLGWIQGHLVCAGRRLHWEIDFTLNKLLYFEWSPPWHVGWWLSGWIGSVICATWITLRIIPTRDKEPWRNPSHLFSGILRALVVSCPPFSIAPGTSVCESKAQTCRSRNMPNHVRTPPGKHISINRHQTWQYTSWSKVKS